jgi:hypothetical protein
LILFFDFCIKLFKYVKAFYDERNFLLESNLEKFFSNFKFN